MKHSSEKNAVSKLDDTSYKSNSKMNKKEIDWEERHFQICLAMLSCPVSDSVGMTKAPVPGDIIARADRMIDLLKQKYADETASHESITNDGTELESKSDSKSAQKPAKRFAGFWAPRIRQSEQFSKIWKALQTQGFSRGDDIPYFHIDEACQEADVDINDIDINKFEETFDVNIG